MNSTPHLTRQQLCAEMHVSESTVRRWEQSGLPYTPIGARGKRYNLGEVKQWLAKNGSTSCQSGKTNAGPCRKLHQELHQAKEKAPSVAAKCLIYMVGDTWIEHVTPAV